MNAIKLAGAGGKPGDVFKTPGRTLGGDQPVRGRSQVPSFNIISWFKALVALVGLYLVSLFSVSESSMWWTSFAD